MPTSAHQARFRLSCEPHKRFREMIEPSHGAGATSVSQSCDTVRVSSRTRAGGVVTGLRALDGCGVFIRPRRWVIPCARGLAGMGKSDKTRRSVLCDRPSGVMLLTVTSYCYMAVTPRGRCDSAVLGAV